MQFAGQPKPPVGILFDSDMGRDIDQALALALLYGFDGKNEARIVALSVSGPSLNAAAFCDAVGRFYAGPVNGGFGGFARSLPVGLSTTGKTLEDAPMLAVPLDRKKPDGTPAYVHNIHKLNDTADPAALIRNALTSQYDQNSLVVLAGPATNLVRVLALPGVKELIARKVRFLTIAAGAYGEGKPDYTIQADIPSAKKLFAEWPTPIVACGAEIAGGVLYPAASIEKDFEWSPAHPVVDAYRAYKPMPYDAPTRDMAAVLYAVRPQEGYFKLSAPGTISVLDDGRTEFNVSAEGRHRYLISDPEQLARILKVYTEVASAKPVPRQPFRRPKADVKADVKPDVKPEEKPEVKPQP